MSGLTDCGHDLGDIARVSCWEDTRRTYHRTWETRVGVANEGRRPQPLIFPRTNSGNYPANQQQLLCF